MGPQIARYQKMQELLIIIPQMFNKMEWAGVFNSVLGLQKFPKQKKKWNE